MNALLRTVLFLIPFLCFSQSGGYSLLPLETIALEKVGFIGVDKYDALYYTKNNTLFKQDDEKTVEFQDFQLGNIGTVSLINPLKISVFYPDYGVAVLLDNNLNEIDRVSFMQTPPFLNILNATLASENRLWIFNQDNQQLELFNYASNKKQTLSRPISESYLTHVANFNFCYVLTEEKIRLFNIYGSQLQQFPNENYLELCENDNRLLAKKEDNSLVLFIEKLTEKYLLPETEISIKDFYLREDFLYLYDGKLLHKLKLTQAKQ